MNRYLKQTLFAAIGESGQELIRQTKILVVGCGALGSVISESLVRAGIGSIRIVDRDFVEISNLQRQVLFDMQDVAQHRPKAIAAAEKLSAINDLVVIEPVVADVHANNIQELARDCQIIMDGTDNFETRFLINDLSLEYNIPWVHGGCLAAHGQVMAFVPKQTPCYRCLIDSEPDETETCDTAGVIGPAVNVIASLQVTEALKLIVNNFQIDQPRMLTIDLWEGTFHSIDMSPLLNRTDCPACGLGERLWLNGERGAATTILCGRNAVQVSPAERKKISLSGLEDRLSPLGEVNPSPYLLRFTPANEELQFHIFSDGRAIIQGTEDIALAKTQYARYVGS